MDPQRGGTRRSRRLARGAPHSALCGRTTHSPCWPDSRQQIGHSMSSPLNVVIEGGGAVGAAVGAGGG
eukprot:7714470-Pyramimonas_sp.AAC.1